MISIILIAIILILILKMKNEKLTDILSWIIGLPLLALFFYLSNWLTTWWTAFKLSFFGF